MATKITAAKGLGGTESPPGDGEASSLTEIHRRDAVSPTPPTSSDDGWAVLLGDIDTPGSQTLSMKKKHLEAKPSTALSENAIGPLLDKPNRGRVTYAKVPSRVDTHVPVDLDWAQTALR
jgi:hypothetical protein